MKHLLPFLLLSVFTLSLKAQHIEVLQQGNPTSIRGLSVVDDHVAWISGSKGTIAVTTNGGKTWDWQQVKGFEKSDFRDIEAFSSKEAIIMSSGTPALILKTTDGGQSWKVKYKNTDTAFFFDAMEFSDRLNGYVLGDPIDGKFVLMETRDGGERWDAFRKRPNAIRDEAAFAASGTCLRVDKNKINIVTGGSRSQLLEYSASNNIWDYSPLPVLSGKSSQGAFSLASSTNGAAKIFVGGDYADDKKTDSVASYLTNRSNLIKVATQGPAGFQSCVEYISGETFLSTGTPGSNLTTDGGKTWRKIDDISYNVCRKARHGKLVLLAGNGGRIGIFKL
ncbi:YCF48-related protein [Mucilaginibacter sp. BT774]|uniref:WD40/YVTN/BNR-like repeat-containing protein n=1 Tax=Mucilaginibacter sp. BT774 TaxID=3062276 RepID=UPI002676DEA2|nr:YCF48-related protein [Mucilaginibacter sp. BT774]MDO3624735.1 YCF48-related protein [Mucilaginibacter sp. BT774]